MGGTRVFRILLHPFCDRPTLLYYVTNPRSSKKELHQVKTKQRQQRAKSLDQTSYTHHPRWPRKRAPAKEASSRNARAANHPKTAAPTTTIYYPIHAEETNRTPAATGKRTRNAGTPMYRKMNKTTQTATKRFPKHTRGTEGNRRTQAQRPSKHRNTAQT